MTTAGADIKEMKDKSCECPPLVTGDFPTKFLEVAEAYTTNFLANWEVIAKLQKPVIAAVSGYAVCPQTHLLVTTSSFEFLPSARWWLGACIAS
jgi:enoyl-CoA hydratase